MPRTRYSAEEIIAMLREADFRVSQGEICLATQYGRYGYRRITALPNAEGWAVNVKRVYRIWRREGLKVPLKQPGRGRL